MEAWEKLMQIAVNSEARIITRIEDLEPALQGPTYAIVALCRETNQRQSTFPLPDTSTEVYAYPMGEMTAWGCNAPVTGFMFARGTV